MKPTGGPRCPRLASPAPADRSVALECLCVAYPLLGEPDLAIASCEALLARAPNDWRVLNNLGNAHLHADRLLQAIGFYRRALVALKEGDASGVARHVQSGRPVRGEEIVGTNLENALQRLRDPPSDEDETREAPRSPEVA